MKDTKKTKARSATTRPTKKQHETLDFIREFIAENGYSPSYREIMRGCNYTSVATVALHVSNLIKRGHIVKRDKSARSLEVVKGIKEEKGATSNHKNELTKAIDARFKKLEKESSQKALDEVYVLVGALKILGHGEAAAAYTARIKDHGTKK